MDLEDVIWLSYHDDEPKKVWNHSNIPMKK